jgi:hypothetical protein
MVSEQRVSAPVLNQFRGLLLARLKAVSACGICFFARFQQDVKIGRQNWYFSKMIFLVMGSTFSHTCSVHSSVTALPGRHPIGQHIFKPNHQP